MAMRYEVTKAFARKADAGQIIGRTTFAVEGTFTMDGNPVAKDAGEYLLAFMFNPLLDSYASADSLEDAAKLYKAKKAKIAEDRTSARATDPIEVHRRAVVRDSLNGEKRAGDKATFAKVASDGRAKWLDAYFAAQGEAYRAKVEELAKGREAAARAAREAAGALDL